MTRYKVVHKATGLKWLALPEVFETFEAACKAREQFGDEAVVYSKTFYDNYGTAFLDGCESVLGYSNPPVASNEDGQRLLSEIETFNEWEQ